MRRISRRSILKTGAASAALSVLPRIGLAQEGETETHGLSSFGELKYAPDFKHFDYVIPPHPRRHAGDPDQADDRQPELRHLQHAQRVFVLQRRRRSGHDGHLRHADGRFRR